MESHPHAVSQEFQASIRKTAGIAGPMARTFPHWILLGGLLLLGQCACPDKSAARQLLGRRERRRGLTGGTLFIVLRFRPKRVGHSCRYIKGWMRSLSN